MASFVNWLNEQARRDNDPVGWFARYWRDLPEHPRLSSPASIARHLEDRGLFASTEGLTTAYDAALKEYRTVRSQVVQDVSGVPLPPEVQDPGLAVQQATQAGIAAAQAHRVPAPTQLDRIEAKLDRIMGILGADVTWPEPVVPGIAWHELFAVADMAAEVEG